MAMTKAYAMATLEASVGVNHPMENPLRMIKGVIKDSIELKN